MSTGTLDGKIVNIEERKELKEKDIESTNLIPRAINEISEMLEENRLNESKSGEKIKNINDISFAMENAIRDFNDAKKGTESEINFIKKYRDVINLGIQKLSEKIKNRYIGKLEEYKDVLDKAYESQIDKRDDSINTRIERENTNLKDFITFFIEEINLRTIDSTKTFLGAEKDFEEQYSKIEEIIKEYQTARSRNDFKEFFENIKIDEKDSDAMKKYKKELLEKSREILAA